jgi:phenylacetate-CoA ligase
MNGTYLLARRAGAAVLRRVSLLNAWTDPYASITRLIANSDHWDSERTAGWQLQQLNRLLNHALRHCPGHARKLRFAGFDGALKRIDDLSGLPFFTKDELRADKADFTAINYPSTALRPVTSGGTTGNPTRFMVEARSYDPVFSAWRQAMWRRAGFVTGSRCLDLTWAFDGDDPLRESNDSRYVFLSIHALDKGMLGTWWERVKALRPQFIVGFPSTAAAFAKLLPAPGALGGIRALLLASETLISSQRAVLAASFPESRIFQWYGMSELAGFASGCELSDNFHHWPQSGILEIISDGGQLVSKPGHSGEIVLTGFLNLATPFIRYRTGDRGTLGEPCGGCGRPHAVLAAIEGRTRDILLGATYRQVPISALNFHSDEFRLVFAHQFIQDQPGQVVLRIVPRSGFDDRCLAEIKRLVGEKLGTDITLTVESVSSIPRTMRGKQPLIVQRCSRANVDL